MKITITELQEEITALIELQAALCPKHDTQNYYKGKAGGVLVERSAIEDVANFEQKYAKTDAVIVVEDGEIKKRSRLV